MTPEDCESCIYLDKEAYEEKSDMAWASDKCSCDYNQCTHYPLAKSTTNNFEPVE